MNNKELRNKYKEYLNLRKSKDIDSKMKQFDYYMKRRIQAKEGERFIVEDELIDFFDAIDQSVNRFETFARKIRRLYPVKDYPRVLDVGCGVLMNLSLELARYGYEVTGIDPTVLTKEELLDVRKKLVRMKMLQNVREKEMEKITIVKDHFNYKVTNLESYDLIVGLEPCEATEHILRGSLMQNKSCIISLCATAHETLDGTTFENRFLWYDYLKSIDSKIIQQEIWIQGNHHILMYTNEKKK